MRKIMVYVLSALMMVGCNVKPDNTVKEENGVEFKVLVMDGCEYIYYKDKGANGQSLVHKGNCKNHK